MKRAIQPVRRELARATHAQNTNIFNNPTLAALSGGYRWRLYLEFQVSAFQLAALATANTYYPSDALLKQIRNLKLQIPGIFETQDALTGEEWAFFWKLFGEDGRWPTRFNADQEQIAAIETDYKVFLRVPLWIPDPWAAGYERCGLHPLHLANMKFTLRTGALSDSDLVNTTVGALAGDWVLVAEGYRASHVILPPKMHFSRETLQAGVFKGFDTISKNGNTTSAMMLRMLAAVSLVTADPSGAGVPIVQGGLPLAEKDLIQIDGEQLNDNEETIYMAASRLRRDLVMGQNRADGYTDDTVVTWPTAYPMILNPRSYYFATQKPSVHYYQSPFADLGDAVKAKSTFQVKPQSNRDTYAIMYQAHSEATLAEHRKIGIPADASATFLLKNGLEAQYNESAMSILPLKLN